jgi:general secretion pathway protein J
MTLLEIMISVAVLTMMLTSVWASFRGTMDGIAATKVVQDRYSTIRAGLSRISAEVSMSYLSFNRPAGDTKHYTLFEGRDSFENDSLTFSAFAHIRMRKDANESDQAIIQYFIADDPNERGRRHLYRRESRRLTGDLPERLEDFFPAYVMIEDVAGFDVKYWDNGRRAWLDEWATMRTGMQPDRLPERVRVTLRVKDTDPTARPLQFTMQIPLLLQEKIDLSK